MEKLEATFRIVTPMFIGGADQSPSDGIRPPSVKGALRFWWRALNWGRFRRPGATDASALKALHDEEAKLFGLAADGKGGGGQGRFLLTVRHDELTTTEKGTVHPKFKPTREKTSNGKKVPDETHLAAARYLGYGLMTAFTSRDRETRAIKARAGQLDRGCLNENQIFTVTLTFRDKVDDSVLNALKALGLLGGLGSRSRHGMGSIALEKIVDDEKKEIWIATTQEDYEHKVKELLGSFASVPEPGYSAFSKESRVDVLLSEDTPYEVLDQFGMKMLDYRSWGRTAGGNVLPSGKVSEKRFEDDHDWFRVYSWAAANPNFHPRRVVFGLPHNYHRNHHHVISENHERRASPLLFHVHPVGDKFIGVGIYLQAQFLPSGEKIKANGTDVPASIDWSFITGFLDGKVGNPPTGADRFPGKKAVLP
jgi:CRISPR-associated protein Cmr1